MKTLCVSLLTLSAILLAPVATAGPESLAQTPLNTCSATAGAVASWTVPAGADDAPLALLPQEPVQTTSCSVDCDCPSGQICDSGTCAIDVGPLPHCRCDAECSAGEICVDGLCEAGGTSCSVDCDCPSGQICDNGTCVVDVGPLPHCRCNAECPAGESCVDEVCEDLTL